MSCAVVIEAPGEHRLTEHTPRAPDAGEALIRVHAAGICGSDREVYQGNRPEGYVRYPLTPGHEWSGTVAAVGDGAPAGLVGRKVVGEGFRNCQVCDRCHAGETTLCTAGYGLANGDWSMFGGAFYLFSINCVFIAASTVIVIEYLRLPHRKFVDQRVERAGAI